LTRFLWWSLSLLCTRTFVSQPMVSCVVVSISPMVGSFSFQSWSDDADKRPCILKPKHVLCLYSAGLLWTFIPHLWLMFADKRPSILKPKLVLCLYSAGLLWTFISHLWLLFDKSCQTNYSSDKKKRGGELATPIWIF
jgi:hypothetical protein